MRVCVCVCVWVGVCVHLSGGVGGGQFTMRYGQRRLC